MIFISFSNQIIVIVLCFGLSLFFLRWFFWIVKRHCLNNSALKKTNKGQTFKDWLLYSRYHDIIPKILLFLYFTILIIHPLFLIFICVSNFINGLNVVASILVKVIVFFDLGWSTLIYILFWSPGRSSMKIERWITKKHGDKKKKK